MMDLVHVWYDDRYWSKILQGTIPTTVHDLRTSLLPNPMMDLIHAWYDDRYWSKILRGTISTVVHDFKVKVMDLEFLC